MVRTIAVLLTVSISIPALGQSPVDTQLQNAIEPLVRKHEGEVGLAIRSSDGKIHYEYNADVAMPTASLIKLPVLVAAYRMIDGEKLDPSSTIKLGEDDKVPGSGILTQHFSSGVELPFRDYLRLMIRYSDNTATNIVADQIGLRATAETMESLGFQETKLHSKVYRGDTTVFPERSQRFGLGSTTANEMVELLQKLEDSRLASPTSTAAMKQHLLECDDESKLAAKIPANIKFAHKTGAIANCRTDAGILYTSSGPIAVCFLSNKNKDQSWTDENEANVLAAKIGELIAERFGSPDPDKRLREGAIGELVESLQRTLNDRLTPSPDLAVDGDFGPATRAAVARFQRENQIDESGIVTPATWQALGTLIEQDAPVPPPEVVNSESLPLEPQPDLLDPPIVTCKAWAIANGDGEVEFEFNSSMPLEAASTTKIMTAFLVIRYAQSNPNVLDEFIQFSERADNTVGSTSAVRAGETISVRNLLFGLLLPSGNDASVALAEHFGTRIAEATQADNGQVDADRSYDDFVSAMNQATKELGMQQAYYTNTHGLPDEKHVISAADLIRLSHEAMKLELFRDICRTRQFGCVVVGEQGYKRNIIWKNTNQLLEIEGYSGVKTGTTSAAGACLVATGERDGNTLMAVILGSSSSPARYSDVRNLFRWAWRKRAPRAARTN